MLRRGAHRRGWYAGLLATVLTGIFAGTAVGEPDLKVVYTLTNEPGGNRLAVFQRDGHGRSLAAPYFVRTNGRGTGTILDNQGALALSHDGRFLFAVNPGSDTITVFDVSGASVQRVHVAKSHGAQPVSLTTHGNLLFVLNAGGAVGSVDNIAGFTIGSNGRLHPIPHSERPLSGDNTGPAQIGFNREGNVLVVTEKFTNFITCFTVDAQGNPSDPNPQPGAGMEPIGFAFAPDGTLVVSEAFGAAPDAAAVSTYTVDGTGALQVVSSSVGSQQTATCWVAITQNGAFAFTINNGSDSVTGYALDGGGGLTLLDAAGVTAPTGDEPTDVAVHGNSALFVLNTTYGSVGAYAIDAKGRLKLLHIVDGLPLTAPTGLVVR